MNIPQRTRKTALQRLITVLMLATSWSALAQLEPLVISIDPQPGRTLVTLTYINIAFNEAVAGVEASDLLIDGSPASQVVTNDNNNYTFYFPEPPGGPVQVAWASNNGITDTSPSHTPFVGGSWSYTINTNVTVKLLINEFLANNNTGIRDEDGNHSGWLELYNAGTLPVTLDGWFLTDTPTNLTKWQFPSGIPLIQAGGFLQTADKSGVVWTSGKDRTNALAPLHTSFKLAHGAGNYVGLVDPNTNVVSSFAPYPAQFADISYGRDAVDPSIVGYFSTPTPGKPNTTHGSGFVPDPIFSVDTGIYTNDTITVTISISNAPPGTTIRYITNPNIALTNQLPLTNSLLYSAPLVLSNCTLIRARAFPPASSTLFPSQIIGRNYIFLDSTDKNFSSELPIMIISTQGQPIPSNVPPGGQRQEGTLAVIDTVRGRSSIQGPLDFMGPAGFELFGQTSIGFPKPPVRIEVHDHYEHQFNASLLGLPADNDWKLRNPWDDKTFLNDYMGYEMFENMGHYSCRRRFVEVFVKQSGGRLSYPNDYAGIEVLFETIKIGKNRVNVPQPTPYDNSDQALGSTGYIFKKDKDSAGDVNFITGGSSGNGNPTLGFSSEALKIQEPKPNNIRVTPGAGGSWPGPGFTQWGTNVMSYLLRYLNQMEKSLYAANWLATNVVGTTNHYSYYMDLDAFVDFHWVVEFTKQIDGIRLSDYFTKQPGFTNQFGQWVAGKVGPGPVWDWNLSWGNANYLRGGTTNGWYYSEQDQGITSNEHIWLRRLINGDAAMGAALPDNSGEGPGAGGDPDFNQRVVDRWSVLRMSICNGTNLLQEIDQLSTMLNEAAQRDTWGPAGKYHGSLVGVYQWPNPDGNVNSTDSRDVDYVHPLNYLGNVTNSIIGQMKKWVMGRYLWIDGQFTRQPTFSAPGGLVTNGYTITLTPPAGATLYFTLDGTDPRLQASPTLAPGGSVSPSAVMSAGPTNLVISSNARIFARARKPGSWYNTWSAPAIETVFTVTPPLRITEIMYHPAPPPLGSPYSASDFEYIEVKNVFGGLLNLSGFSLSGGVQFQFPAIFLSAGQSAVVVANVAAFQSRYSDPSIIILGAYTGRLNNGGDHLVLSGPLQETILDFSYDNNWYPATDGAGFSLVAVDVGASLDAWNSAANWRPSNALNGSPGQDPEVTVTPPRPPVLVNEALTHEDPPAVDAVELYNPTSSPADISGWFLTDNFTKPQKYVIPGGTVIPAGGFKVFYATNSFGDTNSAAAFGFSAQGEDVYVFSGDGVNLTGYAHGFNFGAAPSGVTFGRYVISTGKEHFVAQQANTLGTANAGPLVGPIVVSEINYHPPDIANNNIGFNDFVNEYLELQNITATNVPLYDVNFPTNTWLLRNVVDYRFQTGVTLPPGGFLLLVGFDPAADPAVTANFRTQNFVPANVPIYGPWQNSLNNGGASVELARPDVPVVETNILGVVTNVTIPYILVDKVTYSDTSPWPAAADGLGLTLQKIVPSSYGNDPTNWIAVAPSPGSNFVPGTTPPTITSQPGDLLIASDRTAFFSASAIGTPPLHFQWRFNGLNIAGANSNVLTFLNVQFSQAGVYSLFVYNVGGAALSTNFNLTVRQGLKITTQPTNKVVASGTSAIFALSALGSGTLHYQWQFSGGSILNSSNGTTNPTLVLTNSQTAQTGAYTCLLSDDFDSTNSISANLTVLNPPKFVTQPIAQIAAVGSNVTFTTSLSGTPPLFFRWRKPATLTNGFFNGLIVSGPTDSTLTLTNLNATNAATYTVGVTNLLGVGATGGAQAGLSSNAYLYVMLPPVSQSVSPGANATFSTALVGITNALISYQWQSSIAGPLAGATNASLTLSNVQPASSGDYSVLVTITTNAYVAPATFTAHLQVAVPAPLLSNPQIMPDKSFRGLLNGQVNQSYSLEFSTNLKTWFPLATFTATNASMPFTDATTSNVIQRFYRAHTP